MRDVLEQFLEALPASGQVSRSAFFRVSQSRHFGLAYDVMAPAPIRENGEPKYLPEQRNDWLDGCVEIGISADYPHFYDLWKSSFSPPSSAIEVVELKSRLLVGHGNPSGSEVGLTVHRTWGVPMIPGSALKGIAAHYCHEVYGPVDEKWRGPNWGGNRVTEAPGEHYAKIFGFPNVDGRDDPMRRGWVEFHDALYKPGSAEDDKPFTRDVLTVHQTEYYKNDGAWPTDWDSPNPVSFVTIKPGAQFLLAITGKDGWRALALRLVKEALDDWGAGGKTSLGYGRLAKDTPGTKQRDAQSVTPRSGKAQKGTTQQNRAIYADEEVEIVSEHGKQVKVRFSDGSTEWILRSDIRFRNR